MSDCVRYPAPGCIVEYMEGNAPQIAMITEESGGHLRLLLPNRREMRLNAARILPWIGPMHASGMGREDAVRILESHKKKREALALAVAPLEVWDIAQGEVPQAPARWFAELFTAEPDADAVAACGRALLACKSHFRFQPPDFQIFPAETVEKRLAEQREKQVREALVTGGAAFFRLLWEATCKKSVLPLSGTNGAEGGEWPSPEVAERLKALLRARMIDPESQENENLWRMLVKTLPDVPHLPLQLLTAWGELPEHYNFWLDRAGYAPGDDWWLPHAGEANALVLAAQNCDAPLCDMPFLSIDSASTRDVDDAFFVEPNGTGFILTLALACPALFWPFESPLNKAVLHRGTSIYLPEGTCHMLPEMMATAAFSLTAGQTRPALCMRIQVNGAGNADDCELFIARVRLAANLCYADCQAVFDADQRQAPLPDNATRPYADQLRHGLALARLRQQARIAAGAVIMDRIEPVLHLHGDGADMTVEMEMPAPVRDAQNLVAELMILASASAANWACTHSLSMLHRTQDVALPKEYAGIWTLPEDLTRIMRSLASSCLEVQARPHAALAVARYTPVTSPLRRYTDLVNEAQVTHFLQTGKPLWSEAGLVDILGALSPVLDAAGQAQSFRPRYWKLLYFRQKGDKVWWPGVITEENDAVVNVNLPDQGLFVRGRRLLFDEKAYPGMPVAVRLGKIHPLYNEIQILETAAQ